MSKNLSYETVNTFLYILLKTNGIIDRLAPEPKIALPTIVSFAGDIVPKHWAACNGIELDRA